MVAAPSPSARNHLWCHLRASDTAEAAAAVSLAELQPFAGVTFGNGQSQTLELKCLSAQVCEAAIDGRTLLSASIEEWQGGRFTRRMQTQKIW